MDRRVRGLRNALQVCEERDWGLGTGVWPAPNLQSPAPRLQLQLDGAGSSQLA